MRPRKGLGSFFYALLFLCFLAAPIAAHAEMVDKVLVVINDEVVTQREFDRAFTPIAKSYEQNFQGEELEKRLEEARKGLLEQLINSKLAISLARKANVEINEEELKKRTSAIKSYYDSEEAFLRTLNEKGTNLTEFERDMREQMLAQELIEKEVASSIVITPGEIKELYDKNKDKLISPDKIKLKGIMTRKIDGADNAAAREKIEDVAKELKSGRDFSTTAIERSEGPYAKNGGDMGYVYRGQLLGELDETIFSLKNGEISDIIETPIGYHVFLAEDVQPARPLELDEVSDFLREQLYMKNFGEKLAKWIEEKRKNAYISYK